MTATAVGGTLVIGAGFSLGLVTARMQEDWAAAKQLDAGAAGDPSPVVVREVEVRHVTPDPVVVHRTVRRSVQAPAQPARTVVAPAPRPAPAPRQAPAATTSKTS